MPRNPKVFSVQDSDDDDEDFTNEMACAPVSDDDSEESHSAAVPQLKGPGIETPYIVELFQVLYCFVRLF